VPKVTPKLAQRVYAHFHAEAPAESGGPERPELPTRWPERGVTHVTTGGEVNRE